MAPVTFKDYYDVLGVDKRADAKAIKRAYRTKARALHPDVNKDDPDAANRFKDVNEAYEVLSDPEKRKMFDRFGEDWKQYRDAGISADDPYAGRTRTATDADFESWFTSAQRNGRYQGGPFEYSYTYNDGTEDNSTGFSDFFSMLFGDEQRGRQRQRAPRQRRGNDVDVQATISLAEAFHGTERRVRVNVPTTCSRCSGTGVVREAMCPTCDGSGTVTSTKTLAVMIPKGVKDNARIRVRGQGGAGANGGPNGDAYLIVKVEQDPRFVREADNLLVTELVAVDTMVLGGSIRVATMSGAIDLTVPASTQSGRTIRARGKGMPRFHTAGHGDLLIRLEADIPANISDEERKLYEALRALKAGQAR